MRRLFFPLVRFLLFILCAGSFLPMNASAQTVEPFKRYSKQEPLVQRLYETVDKPSSNSKQVQADLIGTWKRISPATTNPAAVIMLNTMCFRLGGGVEYAYELVKEHRTVVCSETCDVCHSGSDGQLPGKPPNVMLKSPAADDDTVGLLLDVSVDYDNRFPMTSGKVLKFKDMDGNELIFIRDKSIENLSGQTQDEIRTTGENAKGASKQERLIDPGMTKELSTKLKETDMSESERNEAILKLITKGDSSCVPVLIEHIGTNHVIIVRQNAIRALGRIGDKAAVPALLSVLNAPIVGNVNDEAEDNAILRRNAVIALRSIGDAIALPALKNIVAASHEYQSVRNLAKNAIRNIENNTMQR